ncbi:MAG TPA: hypothetical protein VMT88_14125 [Actinomycetes bacterium]|nr:hypothetical protein [Actinomycetes bacterium]
MKQFRPLCVAVAGSIVASILVSLGPAGPASATISGALTVSPSRYVGGQAVTFDGRLGVSGARKIWLQSYMGRPGDEWTRVEGFHSRTSRNGSFKFRYPAPSMFGIKYRVAARGHATPAYTFNARSQDLVLTTVPNSSGVGTGEALAGHPFTIKVDTTPVLSHRPDLPSPVFAGRALTLQRRDAQGRWHKLASTTTDNSGNGSFVVPASDPGCPIFRVRQEAWTKGGSNVGWFPSFPTPVDVVASASSSGSCVTPPSAPSDTTLPPKTASSSQVAATAGGAHKWGQSLWDFAWEQGQSLTSRPSRGSDRHGWWLDRATGLGRANQHNGGLMLDSQREWSGRGDFGTTSATLQGNARKYGRWEAKMRLTRLETGARNYTAKIDLVPSRATDYACGARNITVASVKVGSSSVSIGARNGKRQWRAKRKISSPEGRAVAFAVEVARGHITWFYNGDAIGSVRSRAAVSDVPLTLRLSLIGEQNREMNKTVFISDWQRGFDMSSGKSVTSGHSLRRSGFSGGC